MRAPSSYMTKIHEEVMNNHLEQQSADTNKEMPLFRRHRKSLLILAGVVSAILAYEAISATCGVNCPANYKWSSVKGRCVAC